MRKRALNSILKIEGAVLLTSHHVHTYSPQSCPALPKWSGLGGQFQTDIPERPGLNLSSGLSDKFAKSIGHHQYTCSTSYFIKL